MELPPVPKGAADDLQVVVLTTREVYVLATAAMTLSTQIDKNVEDRIRANALVREVAELAAAAAECRAIGFKLLEEVED